jgi:1,4-dihydroxy-2-naphthoate octaprenyltransferase
MNNNKKGVITCDLEGRIETYNQGAEEIFGYIAEEVIGKKRVSLFSPGQTVLEFVPNWLKVAREQGEYRTKTVFLDRNRNPVPAEIRITPTFKDGQQIGYCGVTEVPWFVITRAPFLTAIIIPILIGASWMVYKGLVQPFPWDLFLLALFAGIFLHVAANTFNDYFDWQSGTDQANNDYFLPYSGGSRSIELGLISAKALFRVALISLLITCISGLILAFRSSPGILIFGVVGALSSYFYTAPPLCLAARKGLGELLIGLNFGPLATAGTVYALTGSVSPSDFLIGIPIGLLTTAILWINQFPDEVSDRETGKINLVVLLGKKRARWGYLLLLALAFGILLYWFAAGALPLSALLILASIPLAVYAGRIAVREYDQRSLIRANAATIQLHLAFGLLLVVGLLVSKFFRGIPVA